MNEKPMKVKLVGKDKNYYKIAFPNLKIPVEVDENLYRKMRKSPEYKFLDEEMELNLTYSEVENI